MSVWAGKEEKQRLSTENRTETWEDISPGLETASAFSKVEPNHASRTDLDNLVNKNPHKLFSHSSERPRSHSGKANAVGSVQAQNVRTTYCRFLDDARVHLNLAAGED